MPPRRQQIRGILQNRKQFDIEIDNVSGGTNTLISETRLDKDEAKELTNMILVEDGVAAKRWGTDSFGTTYTNRPDGAAEYIKTDGTREIIVVADGKVYKTDSDGGGKTEISGATFTQGTRAHLLQFNEFMYIANGTDALARYNGTSLSTFSGLSTPTWDGTPITRTGLAAGNWTYYYTITAFNDVGETVESTEESITVNKDREDWDASNNVSLAWGDVASATGYNIYMSDVSGNQVFLATTSISEYTDDNTAVPNDFILPPEDDTTTAPLFSYMWISGNRIWGTKDNTRKYRVYFSGTGVNRGNFSPGVGGGYVDLEKGARGTTIAGADFQGVSHVFTETPEGRGTIWQVKIENVTVANDTFEAPVPTKIISSTGSNASRSVVKVENDVLFANKRGVYVLGNEPGIQGVLRTNELSAKIRPYWRALDGGSYDKIAAHYFDAKVFFAVSNASGEPDRIVVFDRERGAWIKDWTVGVSQFLEFTDSSNVTHFLGISDDRLVEFSENNDGDEGTAFTWRYTSPRIPVSEDWASFGKVRKAYIRVRNAVGDIDVTLKGTGKANQINNVGSATISPGNSNAGLGWDPLGSHQIGTSDGTPTTFATESLIKYITLTSTKNLLRDIQWEISGDSLNDQAIITGLLVEGFESSIPLPLSDKL